MIAELDDEVSVRHSEKWSHLNIGRVWSPFV